MGLLVEGRAQISISITDFKRAPLLRVIQMVRSEAERWGASATESEVVGLIPDEALFDAAINALQFYSSRAGQVLGNRIVGP